MSAHPNLLSEIVHRPDLNVTRPRPAPPTPEEAAAAPFTFPEVSRNALPPEPSLLEMAGNFTGAMAKWFAAGLPVVPEAEYKRRTDICDACSYWDPAGNFFMGKCKAPGCGCTTLKRWLATEQCKHPEGSRWG